MPGLRCSCILLCLLLCRISSAEGPPSVRIFAGNPGDDEHHQHYEALLGRLSQTLTERFAIPREKLSIFYGPKAAGYAGVCSRDNLLAEMARMRTAIEKGDDSPCWIIFIGHANLVRGGSMFNLPGPDISMRDLGREISRFPDEAPVVVWSTMTASHSLLRAAAGPRRVVVSATGPKDPENETEFPNAFVAALQDSATDSNSDGKVSVSELFLATRAKVLQIYESGNFVVKEQAQLDGDGDGSGTSRPSRADTLGADRFFLTSSDSKPDFD
ncbi:hypothetical protein ACFQY0_11330 [Haloferula chungangensis]|uniref:EF-hand domain-containing protein n=1 Tax=Haloferula chungangensis TaxID=1048331 RepID=A0ABW2L8K0_9BACT